MQDSSRGPPAGQRGGVTLLDNAYRKMLASPGLSLKDLAMAAPTCKLFMQAFHERCAADEAWAEAAAISAFGASVIDLMIQFPLAPQNDGWDQRDYQSASTLDLFDGAPCPHGSTLTDCWTTVRTPVRVRRWNGTEQMSTECPIWLHRRRPYKRIHVDTFVEAKLDKSGHGLAVHVWGPARLGVPSMGLCILIVKAMAAGRTLKGLLGEHARQVSVFIPIYDWVHDSPYPPDEQAKRALRAFFVVCKRSLPHSTLKWCVPLHVACMVLLAAPGLALAAPL